jgi:hypothetical protein
VSSAADAGTGYCRVAGLKLKAHILIAPGVMNVGFNPCNRGQRRRHHCQPTPSPDPRKAPQKAQRLTRLPGDEGTCFERQVPPVSRMFLYDETMP